MCPQASGAGGKKYAYKGYMTAYQDIGPPTQNVWVTVIDVANARLLFMTFQQYNNESAAKAVAVRWTIDGAVFENSVNAPDSVDFNVCRTFRDSSPGYGYELDLTQQVQSAGSRGTDQRGLSLKVQIRMTSVPGTAQHIEVGCVYDTLEETT